MRSTQVDFMKRVVQKGHVESVYHSANHVYSRVKFLYRDGYFSTQVAARSGGSAILAIPVQVLYLNHRYN